MEFPILLLIKRTETLRHCLCTLQVFGKLIWFRNILSFQLYFSSLGRNEKNTIHKECTLVCNFKEFTYVRVQGTNSNFGWGSIQEWGCIQADTVFQLEIDSKKPEICKATDCQNSVFLH